MKCQICDNRIDWGTGWSVAVRERFCAFSMPDESPVTLTFPLTLRICQHCKARIKWVEVERDSSGKPEHIVVTYRMTV